MTDLENKIVKKIAKNVQRKRLLEKLKYYGPRCTRIDRHFASEFYHWIYRKYGPKAAWKYERLLLRIYK